MQVVKHAIQSRNDSLKAVTFCINEEYWPFVVVIFESTPVSQSRLQVHIWMTSKVSTVSETDMMEKTINLTLTLPTLSAFVSLGPCWLRQSRHPSQ